MPDRILRQGIIDSKKVNSLSWGAEVCYRRLHSLADDYGCFFGEPAMIRANLYPRQLHKVNESDIKKWIEEISSAGLVRFYSIDGDKFLEIIKFNQRLRQKRRKFPEPPKNDDEQPAREQHANGRPEEKRREVESESESESESDIEVRKLINPFSNDFLIYWDKWILFKKKQHKFKYAALEYEQQALDSLAHISQNSEKNAIEIIKSSIANGYKGLFKLDNKTQKNGNTNPDTEKKFGRIPVSEVQRFLQARTGKADG